MPSVPGSEEFADPFGNLQEKLESENARAGRRPARSDVSEENRSRSSGSLPHWSLLYDEVAPAASGPTRYPGLCLAVTRLIYPPISVDFGA